jgi:hypothetical protein
MTNPSVDKGDLPEIELPTLYDRRTVFRRFRKLVAVNWPCICQHLRYIVSKHLFFSGEYDFCRHVFYDKADTASIRFAF